jgi:hypothetical protein
LVGASAIQASVTQPEATANEAAALELLSNRVSGFGGTTASRSLVTLLLIRSLIGTILIARRKEASPSLSTETT